jgi:hypothetical protein
MYGTECLQQMSIIVVDASRDLILSWSNSPAIHTPAH